MHTCARARARAHTHTHTHTHTHSHTHTHTHTDLQVEVLWSPKEESSTEPVCQNPFSSTPSLCHLLIDTSTQTSSTNCRTSNEVPGICLEVASEVGLSGSPLTALIYLWYDTVVHPQNKQGSASFGCCVCEGGVESATQCGGSTHPAH